MDIDDMDKKESKSKKGSERKKMTMDDMKKDRFMSLNIGEEVKFTVDKIEEVPVQNTEYALSQVEHKVEVSTEEGKILSVSTWKLLGMMKEAFRKREEIEGTELEISHTGDGEYDVHYKSDDEGWKKVEDTSKDE